MADQRQPPQNPQAIAKARALTLADMIVKRRDAFAQVAAKHYDPDRLVKLAQAALSRSPKLAECKPETVLLCLMKCAELGLEPDSALPQRRMWLVPRWNNKLRAMECTYQMDYRAQLQLARDTKMVTSIVASEVRENDKFEYRISPLGESMTDFDFEPNVFGTRGNVIGYFAAARLTGGEVQVVAMSKADAERHRDRFAQKTREGAILGPWKTDFDAMALKSCLRKLWNLLPAGATPEAQKIQESAHEEDAQIFDGFADATAEAVEESHAGTAAEVQKRLEGKQEAAVMADAPKTDPKKEAPTAEQPQGEGGPVEDREPGEEG